MPFVQRIIEPKYLSKTPLFNEDGSARVTDEELEAVTNSTLCNALRQLASLSLVADDIFKELGGQLRSIHRRCEDVRVKITGVEVKVVKFDPKKVPVQDPQNIGNCVEQYRGRAAFLILDMVDIVAPSSSSRQQQRL